MKNKLLLVVFLLPLFLHAQNQTGIKKGDKTIVVFPSSLELGSSAEILQSITPSELHQLILKYNEYSFKFKEKKDLIETMSSYFSVEGLVDVDFDLTPTEVKLIRKYNSYLERDLKVQRIASTKASKHLTRAGIYKNASIATGIITAGASYSLISSDPGIQETAAAIAISGSIVAVILNVAGNFQLIKAGRKLEKELDDKAPDSEVN